MTNPYSQFGALKIIPAGLLEQHTREGWQLIAVYGAHRLDAVHTSISQPVGVTRDLDYNGYKLVGFSEQHVLHAAEVQCLVGLDEGSAIKRMNEQLVAANAAAQESKKAAAKAAALVVEHENDVAFNRRLCDEQAKAVEVMRAARNVAQDAQKKLETDLARVRQAIGDLRFREIVAGPP